MQGCDPKSKDYNIMWHFKKGQQSLKRKIPIYKIGLKIKSHVTWYIILRRLITH